jgi:hypothetical protein
MGTSDQPTIPVQAGMGLAAVILGALCIVLSIFVGIESLMIALPVFGVWFLLPLPLLAIVLGMLASRSASGVAGSVLGVIALLICLGFVVVDRIDGADIRAQIGHPAANSLPAGLSMDQLMKFTRAAASQPANP